MRKRDKRKLEEEHSGQVTGFTGFTKADAATQWNSAHRKTVALSATETTSRRLSCPVTGNRFIIDPARAYRYFSTGRPAASMTIGGWLGFPAWCASTSFPAIHIREEKQDEVLNGMR
jgi:hypothetical protein